MASKVFLLAAGLLAVALSGCTAETDDEPTDTGTPATSDPSLGDDVLAQLKALYTDKPMKGGQATPAHQFLMEDDTHFSFLHWNNADISKATGLAFVGDAFLAKGCVGEGGITQDMIDVGYVHFHKETSASWDAGHHTSTNPETMGYWFRHIAAANGVDPMGIGASPIGEVYNLMPSYENAPACLLV